MRLISEGDYCCPWSFPEGAGRSWATSKTLDTFGVESEILYEEVKIE
jgi:hypothetical protein